MPMAAVMHKKGAPDVFRWQRIDIGTPGEGEVRLRHTAVGVNYVDTYHRRGMPHPWPVPPLPTVIGFEGAGIIGALGPGVADFAVGDRVTYGLPPLGAYSQERLMPAEKLIKLPDEIDDLQAAAITLKGLTAQYLLRRTYRVLPGDTILVHAAAGGMGTILCQWAKHLGATVIGTVSTDAKAEAACANGCDHPVVYTRDDFVARVRELTDNEGVPVVYESVGKATFKQSMDCLRPLGVLASYGHASGAPEPVDVIELGTRGSLFVTRPAVMHYMAKREWLLSAADELFEMVKSGALRVRINQTFALKDVAEAHSAIEERRTTGSTVLLPFD